jgi:hypothetical protein
MGMNIRKWVFISLGVVLLFFVGRGIFHYIRISHYTYHPLLDSGNRCRHLFQDSINSKLECFHSFGNHDGADCAYKSDKYRFFVWELAEFRNIELKELYIQKQERIDQLNSEPAYGEFEIGPDPNLLIRDIVRFSVDKELDLLTTGDELTIEKRTDTCLIASGSPNEIAFSNYKREVQIYFQFEALPTYSVLVFLKKNNTFYMILINSFENKAVPLEALQYLKL